MIRFDLILPDLISCYQLLHGVVSLSKCCSGGYSPCTREVSSYNRPCPELLPSGDGVTMVTMPIHIWLPGAAWHHRHGQESDNERTWDRILGQPCHGHSQSQLSRMERREDIGILVSSHCHLHYRGRPRHIMTLDARFNMNFMHLRRIWPRENLGSEKDLPKQPGGGISHINSTAGESLVLNPTRFSSTIFQNCFPKLSNRPYDH